MAAKFGTSGLRGLVDDLTPDLVAGHVRAFLSACPAGSGLWVGRDLRQSSPRLAAVVMDAARAAGIPVTDCGAVPTPALALAAMRAGAAAVMVTGSHIPADRNGLKFYTPTGEITKTDEAAILSLLDMKTGSVMAKNAALMLCTTAGVDWVARYVTGFGPAALSGLRIGFWSHSGVGRDLMIGALRALGAVVVELGRSETFVPVDTEAVDGDTRRRIADWMATHGLDALVSADGDGDRPLLADETGQIVPGDVLGQITAAAVGADTIVTPISSNSGAEAGGRFARVIRTRIGSPFVIAAMQGAQGRVAGYEANGGFLLGFDAAGPAGPLPALVTRDSLLPLVAVLVGARAAGGVAARVAHEPARFTATDRLTDIAPEVSAAFLAGLDDPARQDALLTGLDEVHLATDLTDGRRMIVASGRVLHLRASGNAPELRVYAEAESPAAAARLLSGALDRIAPLCRTGS